MKKKLMILCMLLCSVFGLLACNSHPYENMTVTVYHEQEELKGGEVVNLDIKMGSGAQYVYGQTVIRVEVDDDGKDTDKGVTISGGEGYVTLAKSYDSFMGITSILVQTNENSRTGKFSLTITTNAGNKTRVVDFNIDLALENFSFKEDGLVAVGKGVATPVNNLNSLISFYPENTTQRNIEISLAEFEPSGVDGLYYVEGWDSDTRTFELEYNGEYASIEDGQLITHTTTKDVDGSNIKVNYPKMKVSSQEDYDEYIEVIVLKASFYSSKENLLNDQFLVVPVVSVCNEEDIHLSMNTELGNGEQFEIPKATDGTYEMVFVCAETTLFEKPDYYLYRELNFDIPSDYVVKTEATDGNAIVSIASISGGSQTGNFTVQANSVGTYIHEFTICHKDYPEIFEQKVRVKFIVKDIPTGITINGQDSADLFSIFNIYANGKGEKFSVKLNTTVGKYEYFVFMEDFDEFDKITLKTTNSDNDMVFAKVSNGVISSSSNIKDYTTFKSDSVFYVKHSYEFLPTENAKMGIGVIINMCADSYYGVYSSEELESTFGNLLFSRRFEAKFEMSISRFDFVSSNYYIDLTNGDKIARYETIDGVSQIADPQNGIKICTLPEGQTMESCIKSIDYNKNLITIYSYTGDDGLVSIMAKCNGSRLEGATKVSLEAKNGVTGSVTVSTFMPTIYTNHTDENRVPLGISVDKSSTGYLYMVSGYTAGDDMYKEFSTHSSQLDMLNGSGDSIGKYDSVHTLYGLVGKKIGLKFLDFTYIDGEFEAYDITSKTSKLRVSFNNDGYATYSAGVLSLNRLVIDPSTPLIMTVRYTGGYELEDAEGLSVYKEVEVVHEVRIYIYNALERVDVLSNKTVNLYVSYSLGYFDKTDPVDGSNTRNLSKNTIRASLSPSERNLGANWNEKFGENIATSLIYGFSQKDENVSDANGNAVVLKPSFGTKSYQLKYGDLFRFEVVETNAVEYVYECVVECKLSDSLLAWIKDYYNAGADIDSKTIQNFLNQYVYGKEYSVEVEIYASQFGKLSNLSTVKFVCCYAPKINDFRLITYDDGVYFDIREIAKNPDNSAYTFSYAIDTADCLNKEIIVIGGETEHFSTKVVIGAGKNGQITITPRALKNGGLYYLTFILKDNVSDYRDGNYYYFNEALNQTIRVKVADGSKELPFEIKDALEFGQMLTDIQNANNSDGSDPLAKYYYYTLTRDIDLGDTTLQSIDVLRDDLGFFSLSGVYSYYKNGDRIDSYSKINNLKIDRKIESLTENVYVGLFGRLGKSVEIDNVAIENAVIRVYSDKRLSQGYSISVGSFAGSLEGAILSSVSALGNVSVELDAKEANIYVGGIVGSDNADLNNIGQITGYPGNVIDGIGSTANNVCVEISLKGSAKNVSVGGVIGKQSSTKISTLQVVSNISSKLTAQTKENIGGVIGEMNFAEIETNILQVSPVITVLGESFEGNYGGVVGLVTAGTIRNAVVYFVNVGEVDSYKERTNISISNTIKANVGGIAGTLEGSGNKKITYSYTRSFYSQDIARNSYAGNISVLKVNDGYVGGIVGYVGVGSGNVNVESSYFDGDIMIDGKNDIEITLEEEPSNTFTPNAKAGLMFGKLSKGNIKNSYAVGRIYVDLTTNITGEGYSDVQTTYTYEPITKYTTNGGVIGTANYRENSVGITIPMLGQVSITYETVYDATSAVDFAGVYSVLNSSNVYVGLDSAMIMGTSADDLIDKVNNAVKKASMGSVSKVASSPIELFKVLGFNMTDGTAVSGKEASDYDWFYNEKLNVIDGNYYPVLLNNGLVMYDLVPSGIGIIVNGSVDNIFDISYVTGEGEDKVRHNQLIMFAKVDKSGTYSNDYYEILIDRKPGSNKATIKVTFEGEQITSDLITIPLNDKIEIVLAENGTREAVINLKNNRIYPRSEGEATIEIRSYLDKTIKTSITIKVIKIVEEIKLYEISDTNAYEVENDGHFVYVDEVSNYEVKTYSEKYVPTNNVGYILEMLPYDGVNGSFRLDGREYCYNESGTNIFKLSAENVMRIAGIELGYVRFKLTPYLNLGDVYFEDAYRGIDNEVETLENAYVLDDLAKEFVITVRARAISASNSIAKSSITSKNGFDFVSTIETSNVVLGENGYSFLEDIYVDISLGEKSSINYKALKKISLIDLTSVENLNATYYFSSPYQFEYELINLKITGLRLEKTNIDPVTRKNTYKIYLYMYVSFDKEFYRTNANVYDLNNVNFTASAIPDSNILRTEKGVAYALINGDIKGSTVVGITPSTLTDIFMNYYSRGEGLLGNTENTYPSDNESNNIVPGREGLLKITLAEEFSNSSYVTITLNKNAYAGYVKIEQVAGVMNSVIDGGNVVGTEFDEYQELVYQDYVETSEVYGIKLQKLTCNSGLDTYFNNTYFVKVTLSKEVNYDIVGSTVAIVATSYISSATNDSVNLIRTKALTISPLPSLNAQVEGSNNIFMGVGVKKELDIRYSYLTNDIEVSLSKVVTGGDSTFAEHLFVMDDEGQAVGNTLSLQYLNSGRKYYLALNVEAYKQLGEFDYYSVQLSANEYVEGRTEATVSNIVVNPVEFEIDTISLVGTDYNETLRQTELNIYHGQSVVLRTNVKYVTIEVGDEREIGEYKKKLDTYYGNGGSEEFSPKELFEYSLAGTTVTKDGGNLVSEEHLTENHLELYRVSYLSGKENLEDISRANIYGGIEILYNDYKTNTDGDNYGTVYTLNYALLRGLSISSNNLLKMCLPYHYENGVAVAGPALSGTYMEDEIYFYVNIKDDSTETHPVPIENQNDLRVYAGSKGHYILVNNITLTGWVPVEALFDSLDGNGYTITIVSFDMSTTRTIDEVNAGIFTTISENTLIKNLTIDVGNILVSSTTMLNDAKIVSKSTAETYIHDQAGKIDLTFVSSVNFGVLAGTNNGSLTNIKIVNTKNFGRSDAEDKYLHVLTSNVDKDGNSATSSIGGIVGVNSATGAITNSFVGLNISTETDITLSNGSLETRYYIQTVKSPTSVEYNNLDDKMESVRVYPFVLAGQNRIAGVATENAGIVSNTYTKGLGIYNSSTVESGSITAGLVGTNTNVITSSFVEGGDIVGYRATGLYDGETDRRDIIEAVGNVSGLVYENAQTGLIENSYANVYLETQSSFIAGFVFRNSGTIASSYSTSVNGNNLAYGPFSGVLQRVSQNTGKYENCYYLVIAGEKENDYEDATPMYAENFDTADGVDLKLSDFWRGFSFALQSGVGEEDGIWTIRNGLPKNATTLTDTNSFRILSEIEEIENEDGSSNQQYSYLYDSAYQEGTKGNPLVIESADNFDIKIIGRGRKFGDDYVFGANGANGILGAISAVEYVRIVNNLDFTNRTYANKIDGVYLYETIFAGKLDGNGMTMKNLHIETEDADLDDFGIFRQIGIDSSIASSQTVIKNLNIIVASFKGSNTERTGILAGTIKNANIINLNINGGGVSVSANNMAGSLAGLIIADGENPVSIVDVEISNIVVASQYSSIGSAIDDYTKESSLGRYKEFRLRDKESGSMSEENSSFTGLEFSTRNNVLTISNSQRVSYAGIVAGVLIANNTDTAMELGGEDGLGIENYRSGTKNSTISNVVVSGYFKISNADTAGGLFGYLSENSRIKNCRVILSNSEQLIKSRNYAGGLVGENHGIIEQCFISYSDSVQADYDNTIGDYSLTRNNGKLNLFYQDVDNFYNVAVGGIAGYSENGAIIDSYSKVNVVQPNAFISGGLVGYSQSFNYLGFTYATGAVYARKYMGGIVGLQITENEEIESNEMLYMNTVVALNDWDTYATEISTALYNNYKVLYSNESGFDNFYLKLAEVGNQSLSIDDDFINEYVSLDVEAIENVLISKILDADKDNDGIVSIEEKKTAIKSLINASDEDYNEKIKNYYVDNYIKTLSKLYEDNCSKFIGSVVGASYVFETNNIDGSYKNITEFIGGVSLNRQYATENIKNVFSTTYGDMSIASGSLDRGNRVDTYFGTSFDMSIGTDQTMAIYSYRIPYINSDISYNGYNKLTETEYGMHFNYLDTSKHLDKANFKKVFTAQEYTEQLIGRYYQVDGEIQVKTANIFRGHSGDRFSTMIDNRVFVEEVSPIWEIEENGYMPIINDGSVVSFEHLYASDDDDRLNAVFGSSADDKTYYLNVGTNKVTGGDPSDFEFEIEVDGNNVNYLSSLRSIFIGKSKEIGGEIVRPKIVFVIPNDSEITTIFNTLSGAVFTNVDIEVRVNNDLKVSSKEFGSFGILANTVQSTSFNDVSINIVFANAPNFASVSGLVDGKYDASSSGMVFGELNNSSIKNSTITINNASGKVILDNVSTENFGLAVGVAYRVNIDNVKFNISSTEIDVVRAKSEETANGVNIGGLFGRMQNATMTNSVVCGDGDTNTPNAIEVYDNVVDIKKNIGGIVGYAQNSTINFANRPSDGYFESFKIYYGDSVDLNADAETRLNIGAISGYSYSSNYYGMELFNSEETDDCVIEVAVGSSIGLGYGDTSSSISVGAIIGADLGGSCVGTLTGGTIVGNSYGIKVSAKSYVLNVGGLVGSTTASTKIYNAYNTGKIDVENPRVGKAVVRYDKDGKPMTDSKGNTLFNISYADTFVGGLVGASSGNLTITSILSGGDIELRGTTGANEYRRLGIGGIIGFSKSVVYLNQFSSISDLKFMAGFNGNFGEYSYVSGIIGYNTGRISARNGYTYCEFICDASYSKTMLDNVVYSATTSGSVTEIDKVYYPREFVGNNYTGDSKFIAFAFGDILNEVNPNGELYALTSVMSGVLSTSGNNNVALPVSNALSGVRVDKLYDDLILSGSSRFALNNISAETNGTLTFDALKKYSVITSDGTITNIDTVSDGYYISGMSTEYGKVTIRSGGTTPNDAVFTTNNGVISNIYFDTVQKNIDNNGNVTYKTLAKSLVDTNNGLITGVYTYNKTELQYTIARVNSGRIYGSASANIYVGSLDEFYVFALKNTGVISDCYSSSAGYVENDTRKISLYMVEANKVVSNSGTISNSFYYVPTLIESHNILKGYNKPLKGAQNIDTNKGNTFSVYSGDTSKLASTRSSIWTTENGHTQLRGFKDISGAMHIHIYYNIGTEYNYESAIEVATVTKLNADMRRYANSEFVFSYRVGFYEDENAKPKYSVVRIVDGVGFAQYLDSLASLQYKIPQNTIVAIFGTIEIDGVIPAFSISKNSMLVGLYHEERAGSKNTTSNKSIIEFKNQDYTYLTHELISSNEGIVANIVISGLTIRYETRGVAFAPIHTNSGVINGLEFGKKVKEENGITIYSGQVVVDAKYCEYVSGLVVVNKSSGYISNFKNNGLVIHTNHYFVIFIYNNETGAYVYNLDTLGSLIVSRPSGNPEMYTGSKSYN